MIQDIFPYKLDNQYKPEVVPVGEDRVITIKGPEVLIVAKEETVLEFPKVSDFGEEAVKELIYLFSVDDEKFFLLPECNDIPEGCIYSNIKEVRGSGREPKYRRFALMTAKHLNDWYRDNVFCGRCGAKTVHSDKERAKVCPECKNMIFPKICPAVIVGITNKNKLLLTKYRVGFGHNALVAGFTEIGETAEETVIREVKEETGLDVTNIRYYKSQPWGIADDLLMGFYCDVCGDETIHMDTGELKYAEWVEREEIELQPEDSSLTNEMMFMFKTGQIK